MIRENGAVVLNATLVDRRDMTCDLVAPVVPTEVPVAVEKRDEEMRDSGNLSEYEAPQILVLEGARGVTDQNNLQKPADVDTNSVACLMFLGAPAAAELAQSTTHIML